LFTDFINDAPLNDKFEFFGLESKNFLVNSGSLIFPILVVMIGLFVISKWLNKISTIFFEQEKWRKVGI
jgi:hypothetical protein